LVPTSEYGIYRATDNNQRNKQTKGNPNRAFNLMEIREVTIDRKEPFTKGCTLVAAKNYDHYRRRIYKGDLPKYYVKKRLTDRRGDPGLPKYQYIASRIPLVRPGPDHDDPNDTVDPEPIAKKPNNFHSNLGMIYCERNTLKNMVMISSDAARTCGIEETLVTLCLRDVMHVMFHPLMLRRGWGLPLDEELPDNYPYNIQDQNLAYSATVMKEHIINNCRELAKIELQGITRDSDTKLREYLRGADMAGFTHFILRFDDINCDMGQYWDVYDLNRMLQPAKQEDFTDLYENSHRNWYVCKEN
jgi:hypothetical protein